MRSFCLGLAALALAYAPVSGADGYGFAAPGGYGLKVYRTNYALYPYVQVYFRTFDQNQQPLVNLNELNVGLMVKGKSYDVAKRQYVIQPLRQRQEAVRTVLVLDASKSMAGAPFNAALEAAVRYIAGKRPQDEIAVLSIRDTKEGYDVVSNFERDGNAVVRRLADIRVDGQKTRLYDSVAAAMQLCGMTAQGSEASSVSDIASCSVIVFSDGRDEGSALSREELNGRITNLKIPVPIYSVAYSKTSKEYFKNLESLSKNSFGVYFLIGDAITRMTQVMEQIQNILLSDYVVTFLSYLPVDGESHALKLGVEYPSGSGKFNYDASSFEAIEAPPVPALQAAKAQLSSVLRPLPDGNPYYSAAAPAAPVAPVPAGVPAAR
ncbi:vWA domain-containing protein [Methylogaea oryzae]|uniref:VWFA domain-containing protein n=1 Tax=Methylogaea oryzae TaxID=1295382 RepID=A0A8D4VS14_9GAMM|nr:VWA domain-containing protein [Methylogaea oryzae]BBL72682.1 hypothetical protein MoryE10_32880 [Methylogaea oryzae]